MDEFWVHHVLHSLAIAKIIRFAPGTRVMDVGTGGGFPGIPLAILFPEVNFYLIDSIGKKIKVVEGIRDALGLQHVRTEQIRVENVAEQQDLKGGDFEEEIAPFRSKVKIYSIPDFFSEDFFETKKIIYLKN